MTLLLVGLGSLGLALPGARPSLSLRGDPRWFVPLDTAALTLGLAALTLGLGLSAVVGAIHVASGTSLLRYDGHLAPGGITASALSALLLVVLAGRLTVAARRARRGRRAAHADGWLGQHHNRGDHELVVLPTSVPVAYSVEGLPPQVVISEGLLDRLGSDLVAFVIDHERSHLRRGHRRSLLVAGLTDALFGRISPVARSTMALRLAVERAADEEAVGRDPLCRRRVAMAMSGLGDAQWLPAGGIDSLRYRAGQLLSPAAAGARFEITAAAGLVAFTLVGVAAAIEVSGDLSSLMATIR